MDLNELLQVMDRAAANLTKLDAIWQRAEPMLPSGPSACSSREYENLRRAWSDLLAGLPPIDGWTVSEPLPDIDAAGRAFIDYWEIGEPPSALLNELASPGNELDEYRFRLMRARRRAIRDRLTSLTSTISGVLPRIVEGVARDSGDRLEVSEIEIVRSSISEIERLLGDTTARGGRWSNLHRHMSFGEGQDWHDIVELDWPSVRADIEAASLAEADPLPVPSIDLGVAASTRPAGAASTGLVWSVLGDDEFERLLFDLLRSFSSYQNVEWLMKTRAPDRGRDLSAERVIQDDGGTTRIERAIIQAKHWTTKSVGPSEIAEVLPLLSLWAPPVVRVLIIATSGRFTSDAVAFAEQHNAKAQVPFIELWPDSRLETLLSERPALVAAYGLRP